MWKALVLVLGVSSLAGAEPAEVSVRASLGFEAATGEHTGVVGVRGRFALDHLITSRRIESRLGLGLTFDHGDFFNDSEPTSGPNHMYTYSSAGPELIYTLDDLGRHRDTKLYASVAVVDTFFAHQFRDRMDGWGGRATLGVNWVRSVGRLMEAARPSKCDMGSSGGCGMGEILTLFAPHQLELSVEHDPGTTRVGFVIGYGY